MREIAARTDNFFDASSAIEDLRGTARGMYERLASMRAKVSAQQLSGRAGRSGSGGAWQRPAAPELAQGLRACGAGLHIPHWPQQGADLHLHSPQS